MKIQRPGDKEYWAWLLGCRSFFNYLWHFVDGARFDGVSMVTERLFTEIGLEWVSSPHRQLPLSRIVKEGIERKISTMYVCGDRLVLCFRDSSTKNLPSFPPQLHCRRLFGGRAKIQVLENSHRFPGFGVLTVKLARADYKKST